MKRRHFITAATAAPLAGVTSNLITRVDSEKKLDATIAIGKRTGISIDDLVGWFEGVDVERIAENVMKPPTITWGRDVTRAALSAFKAGEILPPNNAKNPNANFAEAQIRMKADRATAKKHLSYFKRSAEAFPTLMDLA
ncbi:MAG: hypothetical protein KUG74_15510 [Rhodobacteraceae bacterium]|nr:hypothetical protein [Paracoccaceae bacterium]